MHYTWSSNTTFGPGDLLGAQSKRKTSTTLDRRRARRVIMSDISLFPISFTSCRSPSLAGRSSRGKTLALGGWQFSGIFVREQGATPCSSCSPQPSHLARPDAVGGKPTLDNFTDTLQYLNVAAFANVPIIAASGATARPGTLGRNAVRGPGAWNIDLALSKNLKFSRAVAASDSG